MTSPVRLVFLALPLVTACPGPPSSPDSGPDTSPLQAPELASISPTRGLVAGGTAVTLHGVNFEDGARVLFGAAEATSVRWETKRRLSARSPAASAAGTVNVTVVNPDGQGALLPNGFLYETEAPKVIDQALLLNELSTEDSTGNSPLPLSVTADVSVPTVTRGLGQGPGLKAQVGFATVLDSPPEASSFTWVDAAYTSDADGPAAGDHDRDRYTGQLSAPGAVGAQTKVYYLAARFSVDEGATWTFADRDGSSNGISAGQLPKVSASRPRVDWCKLGGELVGAPPEVTLKVGQPGVTVYGQVYQANLTNLAGAGQGIGGQLGYGAKGADPASWNWIDASYHKDSGGGANDEFQASLPNPGAGTYAFAFRYSLAGGPYRYCDADGSEAQGFTSDQAGKLTVAPLGIDRCLLQFPSRLDTRPGADSLVFGRVWAQTVTDQAGAGAGITAELGHGAPGVPPSDPTWTWTPASFNLDADSGAADEYQATLTGPPPGTYEYAFRFSHLGGTPVYCDQDGSANGYATAQGGVLVSKALGIDGCTLVGPAAGAALAGAMTSPFGARVIGKGITDAAGAGAGIVAELGFGPSGTLPSGGGWSWSSAAYDSDQDLGTSDQYSTAFTAPAAGGYDVAYRFSYNGGPFTLCDLDGSGNGYLPAQASKLTVAAAAIASCRLQWVDKSAAASGEKVLAYGRVLVPGATGVPGKCAGIRAQVGVGTQGDDASVSPAWGWKEASFFADRTNPAGGDEDEYQVELQPAYSGNRAVSFRFSADDGASWTYCDQNGSDVGGYEVSQQHALSVGPHDDFGWCSLWTPHTLTQTAGGSTLLFGRVYKSGVTPSATAPIGAWLGYGKKIEDPGLAWTWIPAPFNAEVGNDNEYKVAFSAVPAGAYSYAFRYLNTASGTSYCYGDIDGAGTNGGGLGFNGEAPGPVENLGVASVTP